MSGAGPAGTPAATPRGLAGRLLLIGAGVLVGLYGLYLLLELGSANLLAAVYWLVAGVIVHDGILSMAVVVIGALTLVAVPRRVLAPVTAGLVVLGTVTMTAVAVLTRLGERSDNATLLDRNYTVGWLVFLGLVVIGTGIAVVRTLRPDGPQGDVVREPHDETREPHDEDRG